MWIRDERVTYLLTVISEESLSELHLTLRHDVVHRVLDAQPCSDLVHESLEVRLSAAECADQRLLLGGDAVARESEALGHERQRGRRVGVRERDGVHGFGREG